MLLGKAEADFFQFYHLDIYLYFRQEMSIRRMADLIIELPDESRLSRWFKNDPLVTRDHLLLNVVEALNFLNYQNYYVASGAVGGKEYKKIIKGAPKPIERPHYAEPPKEKKKFVSGSELKKMLQGERLEMTKYVVSHSDACVKSQRSLDPNCGCEKKPVEKDNEGG